MVLNLERAAAVDLAAAVRQKHISPSELVEIFIGKITDANPRLNAVVGTRFDEARADAREQTEQLATAWSTNRSDDLPPFFGVPCTIKECFGLKGLSHTAGSLRRKSKICQEDATAVARLKTAGFIPLGVTNVPEMAFWIETDNLVFGRTNNPWDVTRTVGGSSGGEGAIVGAGASPLGLGSDVGGSIRLPAFFCGVFGHKPTGGLVPGTGHVPAASPSLARFTCFGPIARSARDLLPVLRLLQGPDGKDMGTLATSPDLADAPDDDVSAAGLVVHVVDQVGRFTPTDAVQTALWRAARALEHRGARVEHARLPELKRGFDIWGESMQRGSADGRSLGEWLGDGAAISVVEELARLLIGRGRHTAPALFSAGLEAAGKRLPLVKGGLAVGEALRAKLATMMPTDRHVILSVPFPVEAFPHGGATRLPGAFVYSALWNILEMPATSAPVGFSSAGLPLGVQVIGRRGADRTTIAAARVLEAELGGWIPPASPASSRPR